MSEITTCRENRPGRPRGYAEWRPQAKTRDLLAQVDDILAEYDNYLPLTVRQIFYRLVGAFEYEKTEHAYSRLSEALVRARRARIIPFTSIRDDGVTVMADTWYQGQQDFFEEYARQAERFQRDRQQGQQHRLELWSEAAGMLPQLARVAHVFSVPVYSSSGFVSITAVRSIVDRARLRDQKTVLLHVGDFDPSGESIFDAMARDAQAFLEEDKIIASQEIIPVRVALTADQVADFELPTSPAKESDSRSARWSGETCQLEALAPDELALILESEITSWFDDDIFETQIISEEDDRVSLLRALPKGEA